MARGGSGSARQRRSRKAGNSGAVAQRDDPFAEGNRRASKAGHLTQCQHAAPQMDETGGATGGGRACATMNERTILWVDPFFVSTTETSVDGLQSWNVVWNNGVGITNHTQTKYDAAHG